MGPLAGIKVLELSRILAGPWAGQVLADLGATVIKVEQPGSGDDTRSWGPPFVKNANGADIDGLSAYFLCANRGKRSVAIDFSRPEGQELVRRLAADCDILIENFKVGGLVKYGLDFASLRAINPRLVYCSITGFGQDGPYAHRAGYDFMIQGLGGLMSITGQPDAVPGGGPVKVGVAVTDVFTGLYTAVAALGALHHARATGQGQHVDLSLLDVQVAVLANQALNYLVGGKAPGRLGNAHPNIVPYQSFATADGYIIVAVGNDGQFAKFAGIIGHPDLATDPRYATNPARVENREALCAIVADALLDKPSAHWLRELEAKGVPAGPINTIDQVFADPQVVHRGIRQDLTNGDVVMPSVAAPFRFSETAVAYEQAPPRVGQHSDEVLSQLGLDETEIEVLRRGGVVG